VQVAAFKPLVPPEAVPIEGYPMSISVSAVEKDYKHFIEVAEGRDFTGHASDEDITLFYRNRQKNLELCWSIYFQNVPEITRYVKQQADEKTLDSVVHQILPDAVAIFNQLEPANQIRSDIVSKVTELAYAGDKMMPKRRGQ
jgi:hypothetical protein